MWQNKFDREMPQSQTIGQLKAPWEISTMTQQSGKSRTIRKSNQAAGVHKAHYAYNYVRKSSILLARTGVRKISSVACGFSPVKIHFSDKGERTVQTPCPPPSGSAHERDDAKRREWPEKCKIVIWI